MFVFELPEVGEGVIEGELVKWLVSVGDTVQEDQPICELMTDKATIEISSPKNGTVHKLHCGVGDIIEVHTPLIEIDTDGSAPAKPIEMEEPKKAPPPPKQAPPAPKSAAPVPQAQPTPIPTSSGKVLASPAVRAMANAEGVNLSSIHGTGKGGRITRSDVASARSSAAPTPIRPPAVQSAPLQGQDEEIKIIGLRRKIAEKMVESVQRAPHFTYVDEVDATELVALRKSLKSLAEEKGVKLTYLPFIMKALAIVFSDFPTINANMNEEAFSLILRSSVNIGIATDTPQGLFVPVIKEVQSKNILELAYEINDITTRTRENRVQLHELQGGTFTITSVGNIGGRFATPIINHPEVAILGVNNIRTVPKWVDGEWVPRQVMNLSASFDHRVVDGFTGASAIQMLKRLLESPNSLLLEL